MKTLRSVWRLLNHIGSSMYKRSVNFMRLCILHQSKLILFVALHGIICSAGSSFTSQNVWFCANCIRCSFLGILNGPFSGIINQFVAKLMNDGVRRSARFFLLNYFTDNMLALNLLNETEILFMYGITL